MEAPTREWYESRSDILSRRDEGAETEMVWPRGRCPLADPELDWMLGNSSFILETDAGPSTETDVRLCSSATLLPSGLSGRVAISPVARAKASGRVWSSGDELDLLRV